MEECVILKNIFKKYADVFTEGFGKLKDFKVQLRLKQSAKPVFLKDRLVPFSIRDRVVSELGKLVCCGILVPVTSNNWATPIVAVPKPNGSVRICGYFKCTLNLMLEYEKYPLPKIDDLFAKQAGGEKLLECFGITNMVSQI